MENKEYYLNELKKVLNTEEDLFKLKVGGFMEDEESKVLTLPKSVLIAIYNTINLDI